MNPLSSLKSMLLKLKREEIKSLVLFLNFQLPNPKEDSKSSQLVKMILDDPNYSSLDLQRAIYGHANKVAFYKLVSRLKQKVLEVMLFDQHLEGEAYSPRNRMIYTLRKKLLEVDILFNRGIVDEVESRLNDLKKDARKYELYDVLFQCNVVLRRYFITRKRTKSLENISNEIAFYKKTEFLFDQAGSEFNRMMNKINFSFTSEEYSEELTVLVDNLSQWFQETDSPTIGYYYLLLKLELLQSTSNYDQAEIVLDQLHRLLTLHPGFTTSARQGTYLLNRANNYIYLNNFEESVHYVNQAILEFNGYALNIVLSEEVLFYAKYYLNDYKECRDILERVKKRFRSIDETVVNRFRYYQATLNFQDGNYEKALGELSSLPELARDKEGWNVARKVLQVLCLIEKEDFDSVDLSVFSLQKYLKRIQRQKHLNPRYLVIIRILVKLINEGYDYKTTYEKRKRYFQLLSSKTGDYKWKIKSPELIVINKWFESKLVSKS